MKAKKSPSVPAYRHHKANGQGYVVLNGQWLYLGRYDLPETQQSRIVSKELVKPSLGGVVCLGLIPLTEEILGLTFCKSRHTWQNFPANITLSSV
jgi:hypothetical protein